MHDSNPDLIDWHRALTLAERAALAAAAALSEAVAGRAGPPSPEGVARPDRLPVRNPLGPPPSRSGPRRGVVRAPARAAAGPARRPSRGLDGRAGRSTPADAAALDSLPVPPEIGGAAGFLELIRPFLDRARLRLRGGSGSDRRRDGRLIPFTAGERPAPGRRDPPLPAAAAPLAHPRAGAERGAAAGGAGGRDAAGALRRLRRAPARSGESPTRSGASIRCWPARRSSTSSSSASRRARSSPISPRTGRRSASASSAAVTPAR